MELDDILNGSTPDGAAKDPVERQQAEQNTERSAEPAAPAEAAPATPEPVVERSTSRRKQHQQKERDTREAAEGRVRDENGRYVAKETLEAKTEPAEPAAPATPEPAATAPATQQNNQQNQDFTPREKAFLAAAQEERRKRQEFERKLAEAPAQPAEPAKTFWDDPEAALKHFQQETQTAVVKARLDTSEAIARTRYKDFDDNVAEFGTLMQTVPGVREQWLQSADPAEFAYQVGKRQKEFKSIGNIEEYRQRVASEERAKLEAEFKAREEARAKLAADLPGSLSEARGSGPSARPIFKGPPSLDEILRG